MRSASPYLLLTALLVICWTSHVTAESERKISISVTEEFNDNVTEEPSGEADLVTSVNLLTNYSYTGRITTFEYGTDTSVNHYAAGTFDNQLRTLTALNGTLQLIPDRLAISLDETFQSIFVDPTQGRESGSDSVETQINSNTFTASIALTPQWSERTQPSLSYAYVNQMYSGDGQIDKETHSLIGSIGHTFTPTFSLQASASTDRQTSDTLGFVRTRGFAGLDWEMTKSLSINTELGATWTEYDTFGRTLDPYWDFLLSYEMGKTTFTVGTNSDFIEIPRSALTALDTNYFIGIERQWKRSSLSWETNYSAYLGEDTEESNLFSMSLAATYELSPRLSMDASTRAVIRTDSGSERQTYYASIGMNYEMPKDLKLKASYKFKHNDDATGDDTYTVNAFGLQLSKSF